MYSVVLMAAMSGGPSAAGADMPAVAGPFVAGPVVAGCTGCAGYYAGCGGGGCTGSSCHGGGLFHRSSCHGCCGGLALFGHARSHGCCGGSCFGSYSHGCCGGYSAGYGGSCYGSSWGCTGGVYGTYTYPAYGAPVIVTPGVTTPPMPMGGTIPPKADPKADPTPDPKKKTGEGSGASLKIRVPAEAKLFVDGQLVSAAGAERAFFTPALAPGQKYFYDVRAEVTVAGQVVAEERRVVVEAGAAVTESFGKLFAAVGQPVPTLASK